MTSPHSGGVCPPGGWRRRGGNLSATAEGRPSARPARCLPAATPAATTDTQTTVAVHADRAQAERLQAEGPPFNSKTISNVAASSLDPDHSPDPGSKTSKKAAATAASNRTPASVSVRLQVIPGEVRAERNPALPAAEKLRARPHLWLLPVSLSQTSSLLFRLPPHLLLLLHLLFSGRQLEVTGLRPLGGQASLWTEEISPGLRTLGAGRGRAARADGGLRLAVVPNTLR